MGCFKKKKKIYKGFIGEGGRGWGGGGGGGRGRHSPNRLDPLLFFFHPAE